MVLKDKVAVIYGAGGAIGSAVARAFGREGAKLFLTGRLSAPVEAVAKEVNSAGGSAETAEVDALDEQAASRKSARNERPSVTSVPDGAAKSHISVQRLPGGRHADRLQCRRAAGAKGRRRKEWQHEH